MDFKGIVKEFIRDRRRWQRITSSPFTYAVLGGVLRLTRGGWPLFSMHRMGLYALHETRRAYSGKTPVVWSSAFFPVELAWGLDLCPFAPEVAAAYIAGLGLGEEMLSAAEQAGYSRDICSFHRCIAGAAGWLPRPRALGASFALCDGAPFLFQNLAARYGVPLLVLDVPYNAGPEAVHYVAGQIERIWLDLAALTGRRPDRGRLAEAVGRSGEYRAQMQRVNELRRRAPAPVSGRDILDFVYLSFAAMGSREAVKIAADLAGEIERRAAGYGRAEQEKYRLLWLHLKPYYSEELLDFAWQQGAVLVMEEFSHVWWPPLDPAKPFLSLAEKTLSHFILKPVAERIRVAADLARRYLVDGIVLFAHHGCRQMGGSALMVKDALQDQGWPVLVLEGDCIDGRNEAGAWMQTRLQAFLEILQHRKEW